MAIQEIVLKSNIAVNLLPVNYGNKVTISPDLTPYVKEGYTIISERRELRNLAAINYIQSLEQVDYPEIPVTASESEAAVQLLNLQWLSPRMHLNTWIDNNLVEVLSLLTPKPYPYSNIALKDFNFDSLTNISVSIADVGYGYLVDNDSVVIVGEFNRYIYLEKTENLTFSFNNIAASLQAIATSISELEINITAPPDDTGGGGDDNGGGNDVDDGDDDNNNGDNDFMPLAVKTEDYTVVANGERLLCNPLTSDITITLPANPQTGWEVELIHMNYTAFLVQIDFNGQPFSGANSVALTPDNRGGKLLYNFNYWEFYPNPQGIGGTDFNSAFYTT
ncbi:hypothetical protein [Anabaena lutea]|uniref:Uncharacterized protein n=1 Tax=Anabaena lutea FACHB-196 TaxID=2692881 RepID=A0ABR8FMV5_9NOST|nr:hypothetical protein [Anabaena lutea]MBD2570442.1 hypothetical protein [Anabaena lutea FACHB-196]